MTEENFRGTVESAYGEKLAAAVTFSGKFEKLENVDEIPDAEKLGPADILDVVNAKRKANARQKATVAALNAAGIFKPDPNTPEATRGRIERDMQKLYPALSAEQIRSIVDSMAAASV